MDVGSTAISYMNTASNLGRELVRTQALLTYLVREANMSHTPTGKVALEQVERNNLALNQLVSSNAIKELDETKRLK